MNRWHIAGEAIGLYVEFKKDGEFMPPDIGSIKLTIRDYTGVPLAGFNHAVQADVLGTSVLLNVPQSANLVNEGVENRFVRVNFRVGGIPCIWSDAYKLTAFLPISVLPSDVRNLLGARDKEIKDDEVDLYEAYFTLLRSNSGINIALVQTDDRAMFANRAIALQAALMLLPSMPVRIMKEDALNNASQVRATIDWEKIKAALLAELAVAIGGFLPELSTGFTLNALFIKSNPTDPVTNART